MSISLHRLLTRALAHAGHLDIRQYPSTAELALEAEFAEALEDGVEYTYRYPLRNGVDSIPEDDDDVLPWLLLALAAPTAVRGLRATLRTYLRQAADVGGAVALSEMGSGENFHLRNSALIATINRWADSLVATGSDVSLTNTTAHDLAVQIVNGRAAGLTSGELGTALDNYIDHRAAIRSANIAANETVRYTRIGSAWAYGRNGVKRVIHRLGESETGPCEICEPLAGQSFEIIGGVVIGSDIPLHNNCVCYHEPDLDDWELPADVWTGE